MQTLLHLIVLANKALFAAGSRKKVHAVPAPGARVKLYPNSTRPMLHHTANYSACSPTLCRRAFAATVFAALSAAAAAQANRTDPSAAPAVEDVIQLPAFSVDSSRDVGY